MSELYHECGVAAVYHLPGPEISPLCPEQGPEEVSRLLPRMLLDIQNRGQLAAGVTTFDPTRDQLIDTHKDIGTVAEVFRLSHRGKAESLMREYSGRAGIGHVRYATCGKDDRSYAQPFERHHLQKHKWFSFAFNGQLANYAELRDKLLADDDHHLARETDTEIVMHEISREYSGDKRLRLIEVMRNVSQRFDGAYSLVMLNSLGDMMVARDPLGIKPLCYAKEGPLFAAASESVALINLGFKPESVKSLAPGHAITIEGGEFKIEQFAPSPRRAHCFFEWIYFANVASTLDERSVYLSRTALGVELARIERAAGRVPIDENTIVVPVPDTSKAAADSMAYELGIPSREGLIRNRYAGRTFIEGGGGRQKKAESKYTPLREVLEGKRVFLVEDSIVRSTTMRVLLRRIREQGGAKEIHVRVACPPIIAPCFYGIDMSTIDELFAPKFLHGGSLSDEVQAEMAKELEADSLRYLPVESIARSIARPPEQLCQACITGEYPTPCGQQLYELALEQVGKTNGARTYESVRS
jgi:amidophosphoribosyltransferase